MESTPPLRPQRIDSIDLLRGIIMVIMALDHARDFFHHDAAMYDPLDLTQTTLLLFFTRWITHFCAPLFVFLAGTGTFISLSRGKSKPAMSKFLITRGLWLIVLEFTVVRFAWTFNLDYANDIFVQVIWVIGCSMIVLAGLIHFSIRLTAIFGIAMIAFHNAFDGITPEHAGSFGTLWAFLHVQTMVTLFGNIHLLVFYPLIPWFGVMAVGFSFGALMAKPEAERRKILIRLGLGLMIIFVVIRAMNMYGDPRPWSAQNAFSFTILSFLNTTKYPPSLQYLLMTIGPAIFLLPYLEQWKGSFAQKILIFGRVPMFYYILHIYLLHTISALSMYSRYGPGAFALSALNLPQDFGFSLLVAYIAWISVVIMLYPACKWYAEMKKRSKNPLLGYL